MVNVVAGTLLRRSVASHLNLGDPAGRTCQSVGHLDLMAVLCHGMGIQKERAPFLSADFVSCDGIRYWQIGKGDIGSVEEQLPGAVAYSVEVPASYAPVVGAYLNCMFRKDVGLSS